MTGEPCTALAKQWLEAKLEYDAAILREATRREIEKARVFMEELAYKLNECQEQHGVIEAEE